MKSMFFALLLTVSATVHATPAVISYVSCTGGNARSGSTSVTFTGNFGGQLYFNITNINFGVPFTQQALLVETRRTSTGLSFELHPMVMGGKVYLRLINGTKQGSLTTSDVDDDQDGVPLVCSAQVTGL